jgi:hypothetical protein
MFPEGRNSNYHTNIFIFSLWFEVTLVYQHFRHHAFSIFMIIQFTEMLAYKPACHNKVPSPRKWKHK